MFSKLLKICPCIKSKAHEGTYSEIRSDHAEQDNADTTSAATGQAVHTNDHVPPNQHHSTISRLQKASWNATKATLELVDKRCGALPPLQTVAGLLLDLVNCYELTSANEDSIQRVVKRIQSLYDSIVQRGSASKQLDIRLTKISNDLQPLLSGNFVERFINSTDDAGTLSGFVEDIRDAIIEHQVSLQQDIYSMNCRLLVSDHLNFLDKLPRAKEAGYRSGDYQPCLKGTRVELLQELEDWAISTDDLQIFWLDGMAGTGKSTIAQSFAERLFADGMLGASFFFSRDLADRSNIKMVFPTIAFQLANQLPKFRDALVDVIKANLDVGHLSLADQLLQLLVNPLKLLAEDHKTTPRLIIIVLDAVDECRDPEPESAILSLLSKSVEKIPFVRFFITSRPENAIRSVFNQPLKYRTKELILQDVERTSIDRDIRMYLTTHLSVLASRPGMKVDFPWPSSQDIDVIVQKCSGLFIYASTTVNFIQSLRYDPRDRLNQVVTNIPDSTSGVGKSKVDPLYTQVLKDGFAEIDSNDHTYFDRLKLMIAAVLLAIDPLTRTTLVTLLDVDPLTVTQFLDPLYSVLRVPSDDTHAIQRLHKSFPDFVTDANRCKNPNFYIDLPIYHGKIAFRCLQLMKKSLKKNICSIPPYAMNNEIEDLRARRKEFVDDALEYACRFWTDHISLASKTGEDISCMLDLLKDFFEHRFLLWVETLSILEDVGIAVYSLQRVQEWLQNIAVPTLDLLSSITDCQRFVLQFFDIIQTSAPHIYHSALPSLPTNSQLLKQYESELATEVSVIGVGSSWDACIRTIQVPGFANLVAFSPKGKTIASGISNVGVQIFDAITGVCEITLESPYDVTSLMFSPDGSLLASSSKYSIMLWDIQTGGLVEKLEGHTDVVHTLAFSPSGTTLVSGGDDSDIRVWNPASGNCDAIIKDHSSLICSLCWLSDTVVASGSADGLVQLWDIPARRWLKDCSSHDGRVRSVSCSADGSKLASGSWDSVKVYDVPTGITLKTIRIASEFVSLSSKGDRLVCGSESSDLQIWDLSRDVRPLTIPAAHGSGCSLSGCFSPDETVFASAGGAVKLWTTEFHKGPDSHTGEVRHMCFSEDGSLIASGSEDGTVKIWDPTDCSCLSTLSESTDESNDNLDESTDSGTDESTDSTHKRSFSVTSVAFSPNSTLVGAGLEYGAVMIWDVESQKLRARMYHHEYRVKYIKFSPDGSKLVSLSFDRHISRNNIRVSDAETGSLLAFNDTYRSIEWMTFSDVGEIVVQADGKLEKLKLCAVSTSSPTIGPSEEMAEPPVSFDLVSSTTDDEPTIQPPSPLYRLLKEEEWDLSSRDWDGQWVVGSQGRRVFHWPGASVSTCHMRKLAVGTETGRVAIVDFSNVTY